MVRNSLTCALQGPVCSRSDACKQTRRAPSASGRRPGGTWRTVRVAGLRGGSSPVSSARRPLSRGSSYCPRMRGVCRWTRLLTSSSVLPTSLTAWKRPALPRRRGVRRQCRWRGPGRGRERRCTRTAPDPPVPPHAHRPAAARRVVKHLRSAPTHSHPDDTPSAGETPTTLIREGPRQPTGLRNPGLGPTTTSAVAGPTGTGVATLGGDARCGSPEPRPSAPTSRLRSARVAA